MRSFWLVSALGFGLIASPPNQVFDPIKPDIVRRAGYESTETGSIEGIGVCTIEPNSIRCWDMHRKPLVTLEDAIRAKLNQDRWRSLHFKYGKRNRYLAIQSSKPRSAQISIGDNSLTLDMGAGNVQLLHHVSDTGITDGSATVVIDYKSTVSDLIPFRSGVKSKLPSFEWEVQGWSRNGQAQSNPSIQNYWFVRMGPLHPSEKFATWIVQVYDLAGNLIEFVDKSGKRITKQEYLSINADANSHALMSHAGLKSIRGNALFERGWASGSEAWNADTNIDPSVIGFVKISIVPRRTLLLTGFPLDP